MKKLLALLLCILMCICCVACQVSPKGGGGDPTPPGPGPDPDPGPGPVYTVQRHAVPTGIESTAVNLLEDDMFQYGVNLLDDYVRDLVGYFDYDGRALFTGADAPVSGNDYTVWTQRTRPWELTQWWSKSNLARDCQQTVSGDAYTYSNAYKSVVINPVTGTITLRINGGAEYDYKERVESDKWVHLLLEQYPTPRAMGTVSKIYAYIDFSVDELTSRLTETPSRYGEGGQAAQLVWYFGLTDDVLQKYVWFGMPVFDNRNLGSEILPGENYVFDSGTGSMIYAVDSNDFFTSAPEVGKRYRLTIPLDEAIDQACTFAVQSGEFTAESFDRIYFKSMNLGWELPGTFDAQVSFYQVGIYVV